MYTNVACDWTQSNTRMRTRLASTMKLTVLIISTLLLAGSAPRVHDDTTKNVVVLDDFEADVPGELPKKWRFLSSKAKSFMPLAPYMGPKEKFYVLSENGNNFLRGFTQGEAQRISLPNTKVDWSLSDYPILRWEWRARHLPKGAREDKVNDSGGAVYVSFSKKDWLGRPLSIKYVYSTNLPAGTVVSTGNVKVLVVSSGVDGTGKWVTVMRDVTEDYRKVFGGAPPDEPYTVTLWSDSDNTNTVAEVDFDNLALMKR